MRTAAILLAFAMAGCVEYGNLDAKAAPCPDQPGPAGIWGVVRNRYDEPVARVYVTVIEHEKDGGYGGDVITVSTNDEGRFYFCAASYQYYQLEFNKDGYQSVVRHYEREDYSMFHPVTLEPA